MMYLWPGINLQPSQREQNEEILQLPCPSLLENEGTIKRAQDQPAQDVPGLPQRTPNLFIYWFTRSSDCPLVLWHLIIWYGKWWEPPLLHELLPWHNQSPEHKSLTKQRHQRQFHSATQQLLILNRDRERAKRSCLEVGGFIHWVVSHHWLLPA